MTKFEKVSFEVFLQAVRPNADATEAVKELVRKVYDDIKLPKRATKGSAGYDFYAPIKFKLQYGQAITIPTGIRCIMEDDKVLQLYPRSGQGFKTGVRLANTVGIIDSDYAQSDNEGHIMVRLINTGMKKDLEVEAGGAFCQGIFYNYCVCGKKYFSDLRNVRAVYLFQLFKQHTSVIMISSAHVMAVVERTKYFFNAPQLSFTECLFNFIQRTFINFCFFGQIVHS